MTPEDITEKLINDWLNAVKDIVDKAKSENLKGKLTNAFTDAVSNFEKIEEIVRTNTEFKTFDEMLEVHPELEELRIVELIEEINNKYKIKVQAISHPTSFYSPKDKITKCLFNNIIGAEQETSIATEGQKSKKELTAIVKIDYDKLKNIQYGRDMSQYDKQVYDAVASLAIDNRIVKLSTIYRAMTGNNKARLTAKSTADLSESLDKMASTRIIIDASGEKNGYKMDNYIFKGNLLYLKSLEAEVDGVKEEFIKILDTPILYQYAKAKKQIACTDIAMLNTPINKNKESLALQSYLMERINDMKGDFKNTQINYNTLFERLSINISGDANSRKKRTMIRNTTKEILEYWKKENFIKDYKEYSVLGKNSITGIEILP